MIGRILGYEEFESEYGREPALVHDPALLYETWSAARVLLIERLSGLGIPDKTGCGNGKEIAVYDWFEYDGGDFFVQEDWFGRRTLHVGVLKWTFLTANLVAECFDFLATHHTTFLITLSKATPKVEDMFDIIVAVPHFYVGFYGKSEAAARDALRLRPGYTGIRALFGV